VATSADALLFGQLSILIAIAVATHFTSRRFRQPTIIGEIAIGIVLGPTVLGYLLNGGQPVGASCSISFSPSCPGFDVTLIQVFASLGSIFLLFVIGLESEVRSLYTVKNSAVAFGGVVLPWVGGFLLALNANLVPDSFLAIEGNPVSRFAFATFVGATLVATSTAIAAAVLKELRLMQTDVARTIMGAAVIDDVLGLLVLSIATGVATGAVGLSGFIIVVLIAVAFVVIGTLLGVRVFSRLVTRVQVAGLRLGLKYGGFMLAIALVFLYSAAASFVGLSPIIGAFIAGTIFATAALRNDIREGAERLETIFAPIFFISLGMLVNLWVVPQELLLFGGVLLVVALVTKVVGCGGPARAFGHTRHESLAVGFGMAPRGEVGLIIAAAALGVVISTEVFSLIIVVMVVVSVIPAPFIRRYMRRVQERAKPVALHPAPAAEPDD